MSNNGKMNPLEQLAALAAAGEAARNSEGTTGNNLALLSRLQQQFPQQQQQQFPQQQQQPQPQQQQQAPQQSTQQTQQNGPDSATALLALQSYYNMLVQSQANNNTNNSTSSTSSSTSNMHGGSGAFAAALAGLTGMAQTGSIYEAQLKTQQVPQQLPVLSETAASIAAMPFQHNNNTTTPSVASSKASTITTPSALNLAPKVGGVGSGGAIMSMSMLEHDNIDHHPFEGFINPAGKKQMKRAANRRSAQLSRKRKKQFIEELKDENDELRRKEQILRSLPDLIVVFDSGGKLWFVSHSVERFLSFTASELEGASFWDRLCEDSVRLLKAAFMDSLAARRPEMDTAPLGSGVWELRLVDKDGTQKLVQLNGVVHFAGERPECVCSIRPVDDEPESAAVEEAEKEMMTTSATVSSFADNSNNKPFLVRKIKPQQSVIRPIDKQRVEKLQIINSSSCNSSHNKKAKRCSAKGRIAVRISDSGNSSVESESGGSSDNDNMAGVS